MDVNTKRRCGHPGCTTRPSYGMEGSKTARFCARHAKGGMVNPRSGRVFASTSSVAGDTTGQGDSPEGRGGDEGRKRKDGRYRLSAEPEATLARKRARRASSLSAVKAEGDVSMSMPGAAGAVRCVETMSAVGRMSCLLGPFTRKKQTHAQATR